MVAWAALVAMSTWVWPGTASAGNGKKVAEGAYELKAQTGKNAATFGFSELWALWRLEDGTFKVEGKWRFERDMGERPPKDLGFLIRLSSEFHPSGLEITGVVPGTRLAGNFDCDLGPTEFLCAIRTPKGSAEARLAVESPYDAFLPMPWFLASVALRARRESGQATPVKLIFMDDGDPIALSAFEGQVIYVGTEDLKIAGRTFRADKYELQAHPFPGFFLWLSPQGVLLAMQDSKKPQQRLELVKFKQYAEFGPGR